MGVRLEQSGIVAAEETVQGLLAKIPPRLFKYSGLSGDRLEWMRRLIVESELFFPKPSLFNDPLECRIPTRFEASSSIIEQHWTDVAKELFGHLSEDDRAARIKQLVDDSGTADGRAKLCDRLFHLLTENGTVCLATDPTSMLMWSYYAEGHSGIALRFKTDLDGLLALGQALTEQGTQLFPVQVRYATEFPNCNYYTASKHERLKVLLGTKSGEWAHEDEWRFVLPNRSGALRIPSSTITAIIFGMRIDPRHEDTIRGWVVNRAPAVELLRVANRPNSFDPHLVAA